MRWTIVRRNNEMDYGLKENDMDYGSEENERSYDKRRGDVD